MTEHRDKSSSMSLRLQGAAPQGVFVTGPTHKEDESWFKIQDARGLEYATITIRDEGDGDECHIEMFCIRPRTTEKVLLTLLGDLK